MSTAQPTLDDIWQLFRETDRLIRELQASQRETDLKFKETDLRLKATHQELLDSDRLLTAQLQETDRIVKRVSKQIGDLGNRLGEFVQEMVRPALVRIFRERGLDVHEVHPNIYVERDDEAIEIDLLVVNDQEGVAVECKGRLSMDDVDEHLERLGKLKRMLPKYRDVRLMGAVAAMALPDEVARYAYRKGLYVLAQKGEAIVIRNDGKFTPKVW
jgi:hypothetical protein